MARDTLYNKMNQWYYWYDKMPTVNKENYSDPYKLLEALRYKELDREQLRDRLRHLHGANAGHFRYTWNTDGT